MYAVGFIQGYSPAGNNGLQKLHCKSAKGIMQELQTMRKCVHEIYVMHDFTQKMCEMSMTELWSYCMNNKVMYIKGDYITQKF